MRLTEKTIELSFCSQLTGQLGVRDAIWFGLSQQQECELGFDACSALDGYLLILQFKACYSRKVNIRFSRTGVTALSRRYTVPHDQLCKLKHLATFFTDSVYYVYPDIGNTHELTLNSNLVSQTWLQKVDDIEKNIALPTNKRRHHYAYMSPPHFELRSEPHSYNIFSPTDVVKTVCNLSKNSKNISKWYAEMNSNRLDTGTKTHMFDGLNALGFLWR